MSYVLGTQYMWKVGDHWKDKIKLVHMQYTLQSTNYVSQTSMCTVRKTLHILLSHIRFPSSIFLLDNVPRYDVLLRFSWYFCNFLAEVRIGHILQISIGIKLYQCGFKKYISYLKPIILLALVQHNRTDLCHAITFK